MCCWQPTQKHMLLDLKDWSCERDNAVSQTLGLFRVCLHRVGVVLDKENYPDWPKFDGQRALFCHLGRANLKSREQLPPEVFNVVNENQYTHLLWLSRKSCFATVEQLIWDLAHELRHLQQERECPELFDAGGLLNAEGRSIWGNGAIWLNVPTELDCELAAWRALNRLRSAEMAREHIRRRADDQTVATHYETLLSHDPDVPYAVFDTTLQLLSSHQNELQRNGDDQVDKYKRAIAARRAIRGHPYL